MSFRIPSDLLTLVRERRVIPFVGAGFSAGLGMPGWEGLLKQIAEDLRISESEPQLGFKQLLEHASDDFLKVAEYLYLRAGSNIGPLRLSISNTHTTPASLAESTPHVELVNLGAPQVYTTNFEDAIERTYRELEQATEVVALPRDVAVADPHQTQIVKYHGDLRYDDTLVLTESQYWRRLDLESPMDLKFRSDLLGRSVLFMGYSFSDINIRVIWFKLMRMMEDVPESDRRPSYIVRFEPNPVLEALYRAVGLTTIILDPDSETENDEERTALLGSFLSELATAASDQGRIPGGAEQRMFASKGLIERARADVTGLIGPRSWLGASEALRALSRREVPGPLKEMAFEIVKDLSTMEALIPGQAQEVLTWAMDAWGPRAEITALAMRYLIAEGTREAVLKQELPWDEIWAKSLPEELARPILRAAEAEIRWHETGSYVDDDVVYGGDALKRLADGMAADESTREGALELLRQMAAVYPAIETYEPVMDGPPVLDAVLSEVSSRREKVQEDEEGE